MTEQEENAAATLIMVIGGLLLALLTLSFIYEAGYNSGHKNASLKARIQCLEEQELK